MSVALHVVITCNHPRCNQGVKVRVLTQTPSTMKVARAAVAAFGWVFRTTPGGKGKGRFGKENDYCREHASLYPATELKATTPRPPARKGAPA